ncbi:hypothetical protein GP486_002358 [Trichoglossum hirsutum]|uniref:Uncharacterized protein n=1 Tax=Trichoglossum hirsutum TaxID=265104 RepID=A0A9P8RRT4_9PEZI|nr:hypothetical protein GP486_002358 [Trichoglossum hirsutum]
MGYVNLSMSLGVLVAPLLGGVVYVRGGYYPVFGMAFGFVGLDIVLRLMLVEKKIASQWTATGVGVEYGTMMVSQEGHTEQVGEPQTERRDTPPPDGPVSSPETSGPHAHLLPVITMLKSRRLLAALWGCLVQAALMTSFDSVSSEYATARIGLVNVAKVIPLFVKRVFNWNSAGAGAIFLALIIPSFSSPLVGICLALVMPPLMAEVAYIVSQKERKNPGIFGRSGAYAQAVRGPGEFLFKFVRAVDANGCWI